MRSFPIHIASHRLVRAFVTSLPVLALVPTLCAPASAEGANPATARVYERLLARFDANLDGRLQVSELPPALQQRLASADSDHDGSLTPDELHAFGVSWRAARFARQDKNGDGKLVPSEVGAARWEWLKVADADHDGAATLDEIERAIAAGVLQRISPEEDED
jgi:hypothetical protein